MESNYRLTVTNVKAARVVPEHDAGHERFSSQSPEDRLCKMSRSATFYEWV